jgi:nitrogen fixation NifU-like protein
MDPEEEELYMEQLMDNYKNPRNTGEMKDYTFSKHYKNPSCGDLFDIYVKLDDEENKIIDVKYEGEGCAISTASMSLFSEKIIGMKYNEAKKLEEKDVFEMLGVKISPGRINCALLPIQAFKKGVSEFEEKSKNA